MEGFCPRGFVRKWRMSRGSYVWRELCMEGVLSEGVLSEGVLSEGVLSGGVLSAHRSTHMSHHWSAFHTAVELYTPG